MTFVLHPQLRADTSLIADWPFSRVLLMNDRRFPWIILVPRRAGISELFELAESERTQLTAEISRAGQRLKSWSQCDKVNIGIIGNLVPQMHVHVVARKEDDGVWPRAVWGTGPSMPYGADELSRLVEDLRLAL